MFGMNVMAWNGGDLEKLEVLQNRIGHLALGTPKLMAAEAFRGDLGWSLFSERMVKAVLNYMVRIAQRKQKSVACTGRMKSAVVVMHKLTDAEVKRQCYKGDFSTQEAGVKRQCCRGDFSTQEAGVKRQCCRGDFIKQEDEVENLEYVAPPNPANPPAAMIIKSEVPDGALDDVTVKEEPIDWDQEPQVSSNAVSSTLTMKREDEVCAGARSGHAETDDKLQEGSSGACNTSAVYQRSAAASQEGADSVPSQVSGAVSSVRYQQNCQVPAEVSGTNRDLELHLASSHGKGKMLKCELCGYSTAHQSSLKKHQASKHGIGKLFQCKLCDYSSAEKGSFSAHLGSKHQIGKLLLCAYCAYSSPSNRNLKRHVACKHGVGK
ncbi:Zinc finger C2H2-type [Trinorchestia longiramus]|nr:Zinc finger C2H2-type [Trinorchestia longiramus]